jgi:hypothetical protein
MLARVAQCDLMAQCTHVDVGNPSLAAFGAELMATFPAKITCDRSMQQTRSGWGAGEAGRSR